MRHPPFQPRSANLWRNSNTDFTSLTGAVALSALIREAWRKCGVEVETQVVKAPSGRGEGRVDYHVRIPSLHNGLPR